MCQYCIYFRYLQEALLKMAKDVDFRYNEIYAELDMYLHCVENLITQYENSSDEKRKLISHTQVSKFKPLIKLVRSSNKRLILPIYFILLNIFIN